MRKYALILAAAFALGAAAPANAQWYGGWDGAYVGVGPAAIGVGFGFGGYPYRYGYGYPYYDAGYRYGYDGYYPGYYDGWRTRYVTYSGCEMIRERRIVRHGRVIVRRYCVD
jgi:hypothetical protein